MKPWSAMKQTHRASQGIRIVDLNEEMHASSRLCFRVQQSHPLMNTRLQATRTTFTPHRHPAYLANAPLTYPPPLQAITTIAFTHRHPAYLANAPLTYPGHPPYKKLQASERHAWHPEVLQFTLPELRQF
jgi:hypothetical protein